MNKLSREEAIAEYNRRFQEYEEADKTYQEIVKQYVWSGPISSGQRIPSPPKIIDMNGHREIERASHKLDEAKRKLDQAASELYDAYH